jgi:CHRD domain
MSPARRVPLLSPFAGTAEIVARLSALAFVLVLAGCADGGAPSPPPPKPARPAINPFQTDVSARAYELRLTASGTGSRASGSGTAAIHITAEGDRMCWSIARLRGVPEPLFSYIHRAAKGKSGPVVVSLGAIYRPAGCVTGVAPALLAAIEADPGGYYLAIHNRAHPLGAIRAQL